MLRLMSTEILMPALSPTMEEGKLAKWLVKEGDTVKSGDILAEIETDKATMEFEAVDEGKIGQILVAEGTEGVKVNSPIATLLADGEDAWRRAGQKAATRRSAQGRSHKAKRRRQSGARRAENRNRQRSGNSRRHRVRHPDGARRACATPWPRKCAATSWCS